MSVGLIAAGLLESYDYLLSGAVNMTEATRRLRQMRAKRRELCDAQPAPNAPAERFDDVALRARVARLEAALEKAQFALLYGDKEEFSEALDAIDAALKDKP